MYIRSPVPLLLLVALCGCNAIVGIEERTYVEGGGGAGEGGAGSDCPLLDCASGCVDTLSSDAHCGRCDNACGGGTSCLAGVCDRRLRGGRGSYTNCARSDTAMACWGGNTFGQAGTGTWNGDIAVPEAMVVLPGDSTALFAATSSRSTCVVMDDGSLRCVGANLDGTLGIGTTNGPDNAESNACCYIETSLEPLLPSGAKVLDVVAGGFWAAQDFMCALVEGGDVYCWGHDAPTPVKKVGGAVQLEAGISYACALLASGEVSCWGAPWGAGDYNAVALYPPYKIAGLPKVRAIGSASDVVFAVSNDNALWAWGSNGFGFLGANAQLGLLYYPPIEVPHEFSAEIVQIAGGGSACALLADGTVHCWGRENWLGDGTAGGGVDPVPHQATVSDVVEIAAFSEWVARTGDGSIVSWSPVSLTPSPLVLP